VGGYIQFYFGSSHIRPLPFGSVGGIENEGGIDTE
jgi:hypothetical protein